MNNGFILVFILREEGIVREAKNVAEKSKNKIERNLALLDYFKI